MDKLQTTLSQRTKTASNATNHKQTGYYRQALDEHLQQQCMQIEEATRLQCLKIEEATQQMINTVKANSSDISTITPATTESSCNSTQSNLSQAKLDQMFQILNDSFQKLQNYKKNTD